MDTRERGHVLRTADTMTPPFGVSHEAGDFRMAGIAEDDHMIPLSGVVADQLLNLRNIGAGGIHESQWKPAERRPAVRRNSMGSHDQDSLGQGCGIVCFLDTFGLELIHHLLIVDERAVREYALGVLRELPGLVHGPTDSPAKTCRLSDYHLHADPVSDANKEGRMRTMSGMMLPRE